MPISSKLPKRSDEQRRFGLSLQARKQQLVRDAIWDAAVELFVEKGFDETTIDDIAQAAGVSRRSFFRYFSSKSDLMSHAVSSYGASLADIVRNCPPDYSLSEVFRETVRAGAKQSASGPRVRRIVGIAAKYPAAREAQQAKLAEAQDQVAEAFAERMAKTELGDPQPHLLAGLTLSAVAAIFRMWFHNEGQDIAVSVESVLDHLDRLLCGKQPEETTSSSKRPVRHRTRRN